MVDCPARKTSLLTQLDTKIPSSVTKISKKPPFWQHKTQIYLHVFIKIKIYVKLIIVIELQSLNMCHCKKDNCQKYFDFIRVISTFLQRNKSMIVKARWTSYNFRKIIPFFGKFLNRFDNYIWQQAHGSQRPAEALCCGTQSQREGRGKNWNVIKQPRHWH